MAPGKDVSHLVVKLLWNGFATCALIYTAVWLPTLADRGLPRKV